MGDCRSTAKTGIFKQPLQAVPKIGGWGGSGTFVVVVEFQEMVVTRIPRDTGNVLI